MPLRAEDVPAAGRRETDGDSRGDGLARLIARGQAGDEAALEEFYNRFKGGLFGLAYRYTYDRAAAEDLLQEIFLRVFDHLGEVRNPDTFPGWVYRIGLNACYSWLRSRRVEAQASVPLSDVEAFIGREDEGAAGRDLRKPLDEAIASLPRRLREVFLLHDVQGFKHGEIARTLGLSVGTSKSQLFKARLRLRDLLKSRGLR